MRILVTFAVEAEFAPWRRRHPFRSREIQQSGHVFSDVAFTSEIGSHQVIAYLTGIGWQGSEYALNALLQEKPHIFISSGLAGGLKPQYRVGDVVAARRVGLVNGKGFIGSRATLVEIAHECGAAVADLCLTSENIIGRAQDKRKMADLGDIVEMESFYLLTLASGVQVPSILVRVIGDTMEEDMPLDCSNVVDVNGSVKAKQLVLQLARHPHRIPALIRFGRTTWKAAEQLSIFLDCYVAALEKRSGEFSCDKVEEVAAT